MQNTVKDVQQLTFEYLGGLHWDQFSVIQIKNALMLAVPLY